ncbi:MAG TPA: helix-turn-helix domain-containing protein [Propioniciclava tarda]|mgnify:CR=1 FL=1|nr:helix-turn-helix domain-containing protein [Propioniciclava tarda]HQA30554.1 helix-turn-helix domain-containing protein [Propioniciclava tarda]HQD60023.1 helix-turn-helix domain-containing protein [Propioniciclava tarda]
MAAEQTKRSILLAAERVIADKGFGSARVDEIASAAGVSKSHLYYHFDSKDELLRALVSMRVGDLLEAKARLLADLGPAPSDPRTFIERAVAEVMAPHRDFLRILIVEGISRPDATAPAWSAVESFLDDSAARYAASGRAVDEAQRTALLYFAFLPAAFHVALGRGADADLVTGLVEVRRLVLGQGGTS